MDFDESWHAGTAAVYCQSSSQKSQLSNKCIAFFSVTSHVCYFLTFETSNGNKLPYRTNSNKPCMICHIVTFRKSGKF